MMTKANSAMHPLDDVDIQIEIADAVRSQVQTLLGAPLAAAERDEVARAAKQLAWGEVVRRALELPTVRVALDVQPPADGELLRWCYLPLPTGGCPTLADVAERLGCSTGRAGDLARESFRMYTAFRNRLVAGSTLEHDWVFPEPPQLPAFRGLRR